MADQQLQNPKLYRAENMEKPESHRIGSGTACVYSARCPEKETPNEDAAALLPFDETSAVLAVADGLGGSAAGDRASALAVQALKKSMEEAAKADVMLRTAILNGFEQANKAVQQLGIGAATTLCAVEINDTSARPYHVGDSMILVLGGRGRIKWQSISHSPVGYGVESGLIDETQAMQHEERHIVSNVLGTTKMRIEIGPTIELAPRDILLLASDGLADNLHLDEISDRIKRGSLTEIIQNLASDAASRMQAPASLEPSKPDDFTLIAFRRIN